MSTDRRRAIKAVEKFRKNSEKEIERARSLQTRAKKLSPLRETSPAVAKLFDRLQQKALQASGDLVWADQMIQEIDATMAKAKTGEKTDKKTPKKTDKKAGKKADKSKTATTKSSTAADTKLI